MHILQIIASIAEESSGPSYSVRRLCETLAQIGEDVHLLAVGEPKQQALGNFRYSTFSQDLTRVPALGRLRFSSALRRSAFAEASRMDIVHNHGLWLMPNVYSGRAATRYRRPFVLSPRGTLAPAALQYSRRIKQAFWTLLQGPVVRSAACLHATSEQEYRDIRHAGLRQPVAIIPNGIDLPAASVAPASDRRTLLYLGRLHPIKGIGNLLQAWKRVSAAAPDWRLRLVGPDHAGHRAELESLAARLGLTGCEFAGPRYGEEKQAEYRAAELYVLPSHSENFGMSVAEALAHGIPVITTTGTPWGKVDEVGCGWCVAPDVDALETALRDALARAPSALVAMGGKGCDWMERDFSWTRIARDFQTTYRWLLSGGAPPAYVRLD